MQQVRYDLLQESDAMVVVSTKYTVHFVAPYAASCIAGTKNDPNSGLASPEHKLNLTGLVLGCTEADFCK